MPPPTSTGQPHRVYCGHPPELRSIEWKRNPAYRAGGFYGEVCHECMRFYMAEFHARQKAKIAHRLVALRWYWRHQLDIFDWSRHMAERGFSMDPHPVTLSRGPVSRDGVARERVLRADTAENAATTGHPSPLHGTGPLTKVMHRTPSRLKGARNDKHETRHRQVMV